MCSQSHYIKALSPFQHSRNVNAIVFFNLRYNIAQKLHMLKKLLFCSKKQVSLYEETK